MQPMNAPAPEAPKKKGLGPVAWILIGCGGIILLGCLAFTATIWWGAHKLKNFAEKAEKNPNYLAVSAAELVVKANPDLELVSSDADKGTLTIKDKKSGEVVTFNADDIRNGKFSIESGGKKASIDVTGNPDGTGGTVKIQTNDGSATFGAGNSGEAPSWIPSYPGAALSNFSNIEARGEKSGTYTLKTSDGAGQVIAFFETKLKAAGYSVEKTTMETNGAPSGMVMAKKGSQTVNVTVATQQGETQGLVAYTEKN